jgi:hypothetical protein
MGAIGFLAAAVVLAVLPLIFVVGANVVVDPYDELGNRLIREPLIQVAQAEKIRLFEALHDKPHAVIFGSSRMMEIEPSVFHPSGFNFAVNSALPEDFLAQILWLNERNAVPLEAVIGVDFDVFNPAIATDPRLLATRFLYRLVADFPEIKELAFAREDDHLISGFWRKYFSRRMLGDSIRAVRANLRGLPKRATYSANGLLVRDEDLKKRAREGWSLTIAPEMFAAYVKEKFSGYDAISRARMSIVEKTLQRLSSRGSSITIALTPYHPALLDHIERDPILNRRLREVRLMLGSLSARYGARFVDATNIERIGCRPTEMWDLVHLMPECAERFALGLQS